MGMCLFREGGACTQNVFLYSEILWGFQGELLNGKLEITLAYEYFIILYIPFLNSV